MSLSFRKLKKFLRRISNIHIQKDTPNIFILTTPRSGSTWLMQLLGAQKGIKEINEPFDIRSPFTSQILNTNSWEDLYNRPVSDNMCLNHINGFIKGQFKFGYLNLHPFEKGYKLISHGLVFKLLHACEDKVDLIKKKFNSRIVFLLRHPIPVSLSRKELPRLSTFIYSDFSKNLSSDQLEFAKNTINKGTFLQKAVLDWCLQNVLLLKNNSGGLLITYEQLVLDPIPVLNRLGERFVRC